MSRKMVEFYSKVARRAVRIQNDKKVGLLVNHCSSLKIYISKMEGRRGVKFSSFLQNKMPNPKIQLNLKLKETIHVLR